MRNFLLLGIHPLGVRGHLPARLKDLAGFLNIKITKEKSS